MNAYGIVSGAASTSTAGSVAGSSSGSSAASGFAGMLVQVIGGVQSGASQSASQKLLGGLSGLAGLFNNSAVESGLADLLNLLKGLNEELGKLDTLAAPDANLQEQLAALLAMLQSLFPSLDPILQQVTDLKTGAAGNPSTSGSMADLPKQDPNAMQMITLTLQKSVQQLTEQLGRGEALPQQQTALADSLHRVLQALKQTNASSAAAIQHGQAVEGGNVQSVVRHTVLPLQSTMWAFQANAAMDGGQTASAQTGLTADSADSGSVPGSAVPVWTMLKGDTATALSSGQAHAPSTSQVPVQQFAEQMGKFLIKQFVLTQGNGASEAKISLHPEHLGQVDIKIMIQNGLLTAKFMTENGAARDLLEAQMSQLRTALQGQGLQVEKMEVVQQSSASAASFFQQQHRQQGSDNPDSRNGNRRSGQAYGDIAEFELELERTAYLRESGFGSSLNVTA